MALAVKLTTWEVVEDMQQAFNVFWATQPIQPKISYDNVAEDVVNEDLTMVSSDLEVEGEGWLFLQVLHATGNIAALGTKRFRQIGVMSTSIYVENNKGRKRTGSKIADQALNFFQTTLVAGVTFQNQRINEVGSSGRWWVINVLADFLYDIDRS